MTLVTGLLSSSSEGMNLDLFTNVTYPTDPSEHIELKDGYGLDVIDVTVRPKEHLDREIGYVSLQPGLTDGEYEAYYGVNANLQGKGIISNGLRVVVRRIIEEDLHFSAINFIVAKTNERSIHVARKLGAVTDHHHGNQLKLKLTAEQFAEAQRQGASHGH